MAWTKEKQAVNHRNYMLRPGMKERQLKLGNEWRKRKFEEDPNFREVVRAYKKSHYHRLRLRVLAFYSEGAMKCSNCGFDNIDGLVIDHINNDGAEHRRKIGHGTTTGGKIFSWLIKNNMPDGFQVLCHNCNWIKEIERKRNVLQNRLKNLEERV